MSSLIYSFCGNFNIIFSKLPQLIIKCNVLTIRPAELFPSYNPAHNISELYNVLVQVQFTTSKTKLDI